MIVGGAEVVTVNPVNGADVPEGVVTLTVRTVVAASLAMVIVTGRLVDVPPVPMTPVTPVPPNVTAVAPPNAVPVIVAETVVPTVPVEGVMLVITGETVFTVKPVNAAEVPTDVLTVNVREPGAALPATVIVTGRDVSVPPVPIVAVTPVPLNSTDVALDKYDPLIVAASVVPGFPVFGSMAVMTGGD